MGDRVLLSGAGHGDRGLMRPAELCLQRTVNCKSRVLVALAAFILLLGACSYTEGNLGVSLDDDGDGVEIHYLACPGQQVSAVVVETEDRTPLWEIRDVDVDTPPEVIEVGELPTGFDEVVALDDPLPVARPLQVRVEATNGPQPLQGFQIDDLDTTNVMMDGSRFSPEEWRRRAEVRCGIRDAPTPIDPLISGLRQFLVVLLIPFVVLGLAMFAVSWRRRNR